MDRKKIKIQIQTNQGFDNFVKQINLFSQQDPSIQFSKITPYLNGSSKDQNNCQSINSIQIKNLRRQRFKKNQVFIKETSKNNILVKQRIKSICKNFSKKISRNNIYKTPVYNTQIIDQIHQIKKGIQLTQDQRFIWNMFSSIILIVLLFYQTFLFVFQELATNSIQKLIQSLGIIVCIGQILYNMCAFKQIAGRKITDIRELARQYLYGKFWVDSSMFLSLLFQICTRQQKIIKLIIFLFIFKISSLIQKLQRIQQYIFKTFHYQRYWSLAKIIMFNLIFAHIIAIILNYMVKGIPQLNWQTQKNINTLNWKQRYIWSYYWATTIMLTVGFGDLVPVNTSQVLWIVFIQISSCIVFSYNISCLGNLIGRIRAQGEQISKNKKIFQNIAKKRNLSQQIIQKILHYIDYSVKIKNIFNISEQKQFINSLPQSYKIEVQSQAVKSMLFHIPFFSILRQKTIFDISKYIQRLIFFPQQVIQTQNSQYRILILQKGKISYTFKKFGSTINGVSINQISLTQGQKPFLLNFNFLTLQRPNYEVKSSQYSVIHQLNYDNFINSLRNFPRDYQYYCFLRDRPKNILYQYETIPCKECKSIHSYFSCPKYHYFPNKEIIIMKQHKKRKKQKNLRHTFSRKKVLNFSTMFNLYQIVNGYYQFLQNFNLQQFTQNSIVEYTQVIKQASYAFQYKATYQIFSSLFPDTTKATKVKKEKDNHFTQLFYDNVSDVIASTIHRQFKQIDSTYEDQIWIIDLDVFKQYNIYNKDYNLKEIQKRNRKIVKKRRQQKFLVNQQSSQIC